MWLLTVLCICTIPLASLRESAPPDVDMAVNSFAMTEEEDAIVLLRKVEDNASNDEIEHALYEFRGLLSKEVSRVGEGPIVSCYLLLRESPDYHTVALSLTHFVISDVRACGRDLLEQIHRCLQIRRVCENDLKLPKLLLRSTLSSVVCQLDKVQVDQFVRLVADLHLKVHPDRFGNSHRMLKLFEMMEDRYLLDTKLSLVRETLRLIGRSDLAKKIDFYDPNTSISVTVTTGEVLYTIPVILHFNTSWYSSLGRTLGFWSLAPCSSQEPRDYNAALWQWYSLGGLPCYYYKNNVAISCPEFLICSPPWCHPRSVVHQKTKGMAL